MNAEAALREHLEGKFFVMLHGPTTKVIDRLAHDPKLDLPPPPDPGEPIEGVQPTLGDVLEIAAAVHGKRVAELTSASKPYEYVYARWVYYAVARSMGYTYPVIGAPMRANHTTVMHGLRAGPRKHPMWEECYARVVDVLSTRYPDWKRKEAA